MNELPKSNQYWGWWLTFGVILFLLGLFLLGTPVVTSFSSIVLLGAFLLAAGAIQLIVSALERSREHRWLYLVVSALTIVIGFLILYRPGITLMALTLLLAVFFLSNGLFRILGSLISRFRGWGWYLLNGLISLILGILILAQWPTSSLWVIGLFIGIDFIFAGWALIMVSLLARKHGDSEGY